MADKKRVSWFNVSYVENKKLNITDDGIDGYEFTIRWKYKAQIRKETFRSGMKHNEINKYFAGFGLVPFFDDIMINTSKVLFMTEEQVFGPIEKTRVHITFTDGLELNGLIVSTQFSGWKQSFL